MLVKSDDLDRLVLRCWAASIAKHSASRRAGRRMRPERLGILLAVSVVGVALATDLPPHMEHVGGGWVSCARGYVLQNHRCLSDAEVVHGPTLEISSLPSAGDGAPGTCPSGGCGSFMGSSYLAYSGLAYGGWSTPYYGGWSRSRRCRGGDLITFGQTRSFAPSGFLTAPRRSQVGEGAGRFFGGSSRGVSHHRGGNGRAWR
jgi:hypothetical protein